MKTLLPSNGVLCAAAWLVLLVGCFDTARAQYVTIPDTTFVNWLNSNGFANCLNGNQLDTTCGAVLNATHLLPYAVSISDLTGVQYFKNLDTLDCSNDSITFIPSLPPTLTFFNCQYNKLNSLPTLPSNLVYFNCYSNALSLLPALPTGLGSLTCGANQIDSLPLLPAGLNYLYCDSNLLNKLPVLPATLVQLYCNNNNLSSLPLLPPGLNGLYCNTNQIDSLPALPSTLYNLYCANNLLRSLPALPAHLQNLYCFKNTLDSLPALPASLATLDCSSDGLNSLPTLPPALFYLYCENNNLTSLPALASTLYDIFCSNNQLQSLPALPANLTFFDCENNQIASLPALPLSLQYSDFESNQITSVPNFPSYVQQIALDNNPNLTCLPQFTTINAISFTNTAITCLPSYAPINFCNPSEFSLPICGVNNAGNCPFFWNISGIAYYDSNSNCVFDSQDILQHNVKVQLFENGSLVQQTFTSGTGNYSFGTQDDNYFVQVDTTDLPFTLTCNPVQGYYDTITAMNQFFDNNNFALTCRTDGYDIGVNSILNNYIVPRPATTFTLGCLAGDISQLYGAHCASGISGQVQLIYSGPVTYMGPAAGNLTPSSVTGDSVTWGIANFGLINDGNSFNSMFKIDSLAVPGSPVCFTVNVTPTAGDYNVTNNSLTYCFNVVASLDPNEKEAYPATIDSDGEWLTYTIRFQNTGTAPAVNVRVTDVLSYYLDPSTFQLLAYSAPNITGLFGNTVVFDFPNINLPDSAASDSLSRGFVQYRVKTINLMHGSVVSNSASIYFDLNPAIVTNTVMDTMVGCPPVITSLNNTICSGDTVYVGGHAYFTNGNFADTLTAVNSCDSIIKLALTVTPVPAVSLSWDSMPVYYQDFYVGADSILVWCFSDVFNQAYPLIGGEPEEGVYSGKGIVNNIIYSDSLNFNNQYDTVTYAYFNGCSGFATNIIHLTICTGVNDITTGNISLHPNPTSDLIYIQTQNIQPQTISIHDVNGQLVSTMRFEPQVDVSKLAPGVYLIEVSAPEGVARRRFVKM